MEALLLADEGVDAAMAIGQGRRGRLTVGTMVVLSYRRLPGIAEAMRHQMTEVEVLPELRQYHVECAVADEAEHHAKPRGRQHGPAAAVGFCVGVRSDRGPSHFLACCESASPKLAIIAVHRAMSDLTKSIVSAGGLGWISKPISFISAWI